MNTPGRDTFWDTTKAVLMWLVILGHAIQVLTPDAFFSHPLFKAIYLFHLPLFFYISGYFAFSSITTKKWKSLGKTAMRLLFPVLTFGTLEALLIYTQKAISVQDFLSCYVCLWFLWSLFECQVFGHILISIPHGTWKALVLALPIAISLFFPNSIPYADYLCFSWPFFAIGLYARHRRFTSDSFNARWLWCLIPAAVLLYFFDDGWYIYLAPLKLTAESAFIACYRIIAAIFAGATFLAIMRYISVKLNLEKSGASTLGIYIVQAVICTTASKFSYPAIYSELWVIIPVSLLVYCISYYTYLLTRKVPLAGLLFYGDVGKRK